MEFLQSLWNVITAVADLLVELVQLIAPWTPLLAWIAFWLLAVNWKSLTPILAKGGIVGVLLTYLMTILIWSVIAEPVDGVHHIYGLQLSNVVGKTVYTTGLFVIAALCGTVQNSGCCDKFCQVAEPQVEEHHAAH